MTAGVLVIGAWLITILVWAMLTDRRHQKRMREDRRRYIKSIRHQAGCDIKEEA
jgi:hypothetical protein